VKSRFRLRGVEEHLRLRGVRSHFSPGEGQPARQVTPAAKSQVADGGRMEGVLDTTLPLKSLSPGRYHLAVDARLPNGQSAGRVVLFEVK